MEVRFVKGKQGRTCGWTAYRPPRTVVPGPTMAAGGDVPHDLATFVIEQALAIEHGFWGCVAEGATFRTTDRKRTERGQAIIARHAEELDRAEALVNDIHFGWRRGETTPADDALNATLEAWRSLDEGEALVLEWTVGQRTTRSSGSSRHR